MIVSKVLANCERWFISQYACTSWHKNFFSNFVQTRGRRCAMMSLWVVNVWDRVRCPSPRHSAAAVVPQPGARTHVNPAPNHTKVGQTCHPPWHFLSTFYEDLGKISYLRNYL